jgi:PAS domain S-box-containing protein
MNYLFLIENTQDKFIYVITGAVALLLLLGSIALAVKNTREQFFAPLFKFMIQPFFARRRKMAELIKNCEKINETSEKVDKMSEIMDQVLHELKPNSGGSIKDQVTRIEQKTGNIEKNQQYTFAKLTHSDQISEKALFEVDAVGSWTFVNRSLCQLLGVESKELLNKAWLARLTPDIRERVRNEWKDSIENKMPFDSFQTVMDGRDQEIFPIRVHASPNLDMNGDLIGFFGSVEESNRRK